MMELKSPIRFVLTRSELPAADLRLEADVAVEIFLDFGEVIDRTDRPPAS